MHKLCQIAAIAALAVLSMASVASAGDPITVAVPEPGVIALLATGVGALLVVKFRKRK